jgi:hypothetical protein
MSIIFHHYKQLTKLSEQIEGKANKEKEKKNQKQQQGIGGKDNNDYKNKNY